MNFQADNLIGLALQFLNTASEAIGYLVSAGIRTILPSVQVPASLVSTIGMLAVISILLGLAEVAKKAVWIVVVVGWVLVAIRIALVAVQGA